MKKLFYGDNLWILKDLPTESVDLIYLDPPFNSNRDYNANFSKSASEWDTAQLNAFEDSWSWNEQSEEALDILRGNPMYENVSLMLDSFVKFLNKNDTSAYLAMMAPRLVEMHRVLKSTGSIYLHCDPTASHYLKILMDQIFGKENFRNEIVWKRTTGHNDAKKFGASHDIILYYSKNTKPIFNKIYQKHSENYIEKFYRFSDSDGRKYTLDNTIAPGGRGPQYEFLGITRFWRYTKENMEKLYKEGRIIQTKPGTVPRFKRYLDEQEGVPLQDTWDDIRSIQGQSNEFLGYPTQKPLALLERIILASSNEGDVVLEPFCGCGTALAAAEKLKRNWIGIDITPIAINVIEKRLTEMYGLKSGKDFEVVGDPVDFAGAVKLADEKDKYKFENWVLRILNCIPSKYKVEKGEVISLKGGDGGFDGFAKFSLDRIGDNRGRMIVEVKSGKVGRRDIDIFARAMGREKADIGIFVVLKHENMAKDGYSEATKQGFFTHNLTGIKIPKLQVWSIEEYFEGKKPALPFGGVRGHKEAKRVVSEKKSIEESLF